MQRATYGSRLREPNDIKIPAEIPQDFSKGHDKQKLLK